MGPFLTGIKGSGSQEFTIVIPEKEVVAQGQITPLTVILAKAGIHFSPLIPDFNGVEKGLNPNGTDLKVKALSYVGFKAPYDLNH